MKRSRGHKETLKLALDEANKKYPEHVARVKAESERQRQEADAHQEHVRETAKRIKFD